jgi:hypothetical membrane protein
MTAQTLTAAPAGVTCSPAQRVTKSLLGYGVVAGVVFEASILIQGLTRHGFRIAHDDASLLANGPLGWIQIATFLVTGASVIAAAIGVQRAVPMKWGSRLLAIYGAGLIGAGICTADPAAGFGPGAPAGKAVHISWHGYGHLLFASVGFIALIAACFVVARHFSRSGHRGLAVYSRVTGVVFLAAFLGVTSGSTASAVVVPFYAGVLAAFTWIAVTSVQLYRSVSR